VAVVTKVNFAKPGMGIEEGTVRRWIKVVGEEVQKGEVILEIETAKALQDIEAPTSGRLAQILVAEGEVAQVNTPLALIDDART